MKTTQEAFDLYVNKKVKEYNRGIEIFRKGVAKNREHHEFFKQANKNRSFLGNLFNICSHPQFAPIIPSYPPDLPEHIQVRAIELGLFS